MPIIAIGGVEFLSPSFFLAAAPNADSHVVEAGGA
jgi:hypothetical protein